MEESKPIKEAVQRIAFELRESGATEWEVLKIIKELEGFAGSEAQHRRRASDTLEKLNPAAARTFKSFEKMKVFTSSEKREPFDRGNIIKSLLKETSLSRHVAEKIGGEVEDKIKDMKIEQLNTQIIREMVGVKLLEYGHEGVHAEYSRIGMPAFEVKKRLDQGIFESKEILREYNWLFAIPLKAKQLHFDSAIHIYHPEDFSTKIFSMAKYFEGEREDILLAALEADKSLSTPLSMKALNHSRSGGSKTDKKAQEEAIALEKIFMATGKKRNAELALFSDYEWEKSESKAGAGLLAKAFIEGREIKSLEFAISIDTKYKLKMLPEGKENLHILNYSKEKTSKFGNFAICSSHGSVLQMTAINLEKIVEIAGKEAEFWKKMDEIAAEIEELCSAKRKELLKRHNIDKKTLQEMPAAVALSGLSQASRQLNEQSPAKAAEQVIATMQKRGFLTCTMPAEDSISFFGIAENQGELQQMLLQTPQKTRKSYGHIYIAETVKDAENLLNDCPCVTIRKTGMA